MCWGEQEGAGGGKRMKEGGVQRRGNEQGGWRWGPDAAHPPWSSTDGLASRGARAPDEPTLGQHRRELPGPRDWPLRHVWEGQLHAHPGPTLPQEGDKSEEQRLNLSGSWQQGHSTAYNTAFQLSGLQRIYPNERVELTCMAPTRDYDPSRRIHRLCSWTGKNPAYS